MKHPHATSSSTVPTTWGHAPKAALCALAAFALLTTVRAETETAEPDAFLDYIEATGSQYIDTGVNAETGLKARIDFAWANENISGKDWSLLDAAIDNTVSDKRTRFLMCHIYGGGGKPFFGYGVKQRKNPEGSFPFVGGRRYEIVTDMTDTNSLQLVQNGKNTFSATDLETFKTNGVVNLNLTLYVFACHLSNKATWFSKGKLYELKIWKKNAQSGELDLLRHYLPCIKGGRAGLYDKVEGKIYYSFSDDNFVAGPVLDKPLAFVESLTSDGTNDIYQCFNTWVYGKSGLKSEVEISPLYPTGDHGILACRETKGDTRLFMAYHYETAFRFATGRLPGKSDLNVVAPEVGVRYVIKTDTTPGAQSMTVSANGGEEVEVLKEGVDYGSTYMATTNTLSLLATHRAYDNNFATPVEAILFAAKIWDGDELLRDFVPAVATNSTGVLYAGLYDKVSKRIYKPLKGKISSEQDCPFDLNTEVGAVTNVLVDVPAPKTRLEYVDSDGSLDFVNLGVMAKDGVEMNAVMEWLTVPDDDVFVGARLATSGSSANTRFFLYNAWPAHSIGYAKDLPRISNGGENTYYIPAVNTKYRISSRLDNGEQFLSVSTWNDNRWTLLGRTDRTYTGPMNLGIPMYLFARNLNGKADCFSNTRLYSLKLRETQQDGTYALVRDLIPVNDPLTGGAALWDKVTETYFRNRGKYLLAGGGEERPMEPPFILVVR